MGGGPRTPRWQPNPGMWGSSAIWARRASATLGLRSVEPLDLAGFDHGERPAGLEFERSGPSQPARYPLQDVALRAPDSHRPAENDRFFGRLSEQTLRRPLPVALIDLPEDPREQGRPTQRSTAPGGLEFDGEAGGGLGYIRREVLGPGRDVQTDTNDGARDLRSGHTRLDEDSGHLSVSQDHVVGPLETRFEPGERSDTGGAADTGKSGQQPNRLRPGSQHKGEQQRRPGNGLPAPAPTSPSRRLIFGHNYRAFGRVLGGPIEGIGVGGTGLLHVAHRPGDACQLSFERLLIEVPSHRPILIHRDHD